MPPFSKLRRESRATILLALPLIAGQLSQMLIALADTAMIGRVGTTPLAAAALANNLLILPFMFGIGMATAVSVRVSQARGARDPAAARGALRQGLFVAIAVGLLTVLGTVLTLPALPFLKQKPEVVAAAPTYFVIVAISMIPAIASMVVKFHGDALNRPWVPFWIMLGGVMLNIFLNWILIYGNWGAPRLELEGAGIATLIARVLTFVGLVFWARTDRRIRDWVPRRFLRPPDWTVMRSLLKIGIPASLQLLAEASAFVVATLMIGSLGTAALASHQVAITCAATIFMVPLGLSQALTVRIGEAWGAKEFGRLRSIVISGWILVLGFTFFSAQPFLFLNHSIAGWFLIEPEAIATAASLLLIAAAFQLSDAMQVVCVGSLRRLDDVRTPAIIAVVAYWIVSLPAGWFLAFPIGLGVAGVWWGITFGLTVTAVALGVRIWRKSKPPAVIDES